MGRRVASEWDAPYPLPGFRSQVPQRGAVRVDPRVPWTDRTSDSAVRWGGPARRPRGSARSRRCRRGSWRTSFKASEQLAGPLEWLRPGWSGTPHESVLMRLDVPQITDPVDSTFLYVHRASPRRAGHMRADSGDAQDSRLSNVRNFVTCSECWRDVRGGCAGCQRGELERLQKEVGDRSFIRPGPEVDVRRPGHGPIRPRPPPSTCRKLPRSSSPARRIASSGRAVPPSAVWHADSTAGFADDRSRRARSATRSGLSYRYSAPPPGSTRSCPAWQAAGYAGGA